MAFHTYLQSTVNRENLTEIESKHAMELVLSGKVNSTQLAAFLIALRMKGETADELVGFARAMRDKCVRVPIQRSSDAILDTCGTGGDGSLTFNISTVAAFVIAGAGVKVAKHGNRSLSSHCGSADILEALGVNIEMSPIQMAAALSQVGITFLFAPSLHPAMKHAQAARKELRLRTVFNLLGPLTNPANANVQLVGAPSIRSAELLAEALAALGVHRGFVVHGLDGLDEITTTCETLALEIRGGAIAHHTLTPSDFGLAKAQPESLKAASLEENLRIAQNVLNGMPGPHRDIVVANASAGLVAAGKAESFLEGAALAAESLDSGAAKRKLDQLVIFTQRSATGVLTRLANNV